MKILISEKQRKHYEAMHYVKCVCVCVCVCLCVCAHGKERVSTVVSVIKLTN